MSANPLKGERAVTINGRELRLVYSFAAMALIQDHYDKPFQQVAAEDLAGGLDWRDVPIWFWFGLQQFHPEISREDALQLAGEFGVAETAQAVTAAFMGAFPSAAEAATGGPRPPRPPRTSKAAPTASGDTGGAGSA